MAELQSSYSADLNYPDKTNKTWKLDSNFPQTGFKLDKKWGEQKLLIISSKYIWGNFFSEILNQNFTPKMGHFDFFQTIKNDAEATLLIDEKCISQEASYTSNKILEGLNLQKPIKEKSFLLDCQETWFLLYKTKISDKEQILNTLHKFLEI